MGHSCTKSAKWRDVPMRLDVRIPCDNTYELTPTKVKKRANTKA